MQAYLIFSIGLIASHVTTKELCKNSCKLIPEVRNEQEVCIGSSIKNKQKEMGNEYIKRCSMSLATRDLQIKITV